MADGDLPAEVRQLIARHLATMEQVDVLLLLARTPERWFAVDEIRTELRLADSALPPRTFRELESAGLIATESHAASRYRYAPATAGLRRAVELLAIAYNERPVTLVRAIYSRPTAVQSFEDAFRLRKKDDN